MTASVLRRPLSSITHPILLPKSMFLDCIGLYCFFALLRFKGGKIGDCGNSRSKPFLFCKFVIKIRYFEKYQVVIERMFSLSLFVSRWDFTRLNVRMKNNSFWNHFKLGVWSIICWFISEIFQILVGHCTEDTTSCWYWHEQRSEKRYKNYIRFYLLNSPMMILIFLRFCWARVRFLLNWL